MGLNVRFGKDGFAKNQMVIAVIFSHCAAWRCGLGNGLSGGIADNKECGSGRGDRHIVGSDQRVGKGQAASDFDH